MNRPEFALSQTVFQHISLPYIGTRILFITLSWALFGGLFVDNCQTLTYIKSCEYVGLLSHSSP